MDQGLYSLEVPTISRMLRVPQLCHTRNPWIFRLAVCAEATQFMTPGIVRVRLALPWMVLSQAINLTDSLIIFRKDKDSLIKCTGCTRLEAL